mgnify:CR=1 FL=1
MVQKDQPFERAAPGVHSAVLDLVRNSVSSPSRIVDLGTGQGALAQELARLGHDVTAVDINVEDFRATGRIEYYSLDFNDTGALSDFVSSRSKSYDVALGVEVIEHLENPWAYVRALANLARADGLVVVTTPNTASWHSRLTFLRRGEFDDFGVRGQDGHINPTSPWELQSIMLRAGIRDLALTPVADIYSQASVRQRAIRTAARLMRPAQAGLLDGLCVVACGRAPA